MRPRDLVARLGSDVFAVLLPEAGIEDGKRLGRLADPFRFAAGSLKSWR